MFNFIEFVIYLVFEILMIFVMLSYFSKVSKRKLEIKLSNIIIIIMFDILIVSNNLYGPINLRLFISILASILLNKIIFKISLKESSTYTIIFFVFSFILELLLAIILTIFKVNDLSNLNNNFILKNIFTLIESIIVYIVFSTDKMNNLINKVMISIKDEINFTKIVAFTIIFLNIITLLLTKDSDNMSIVILSISSIIFILFCSNVIINDKYNIGNLKELNTNLKNSYKAYSKTIDECRELKHNLKNDLLAIKSIVLKRHQKSINELILKYNKRYDWISKIDDIPEGIQGIIYLKSNEAKKKKIEMYIEVKNNVKDVEKDYFELCSFIGIILDNAIESSIRCKGKIISVYIKEINNILEIEVINIFKDKIDIEKIGNKNYSTKKEKSGIGLNYIKKFKKSKITVNYNIINNLFITKLKCKH